MRHLAWILAALLVPAPALAGAGAKPVAWTKLADCAALYGVDARLAPATAAGASAAASAYARAAAERYRLQRKATPAAAEHAVDSRIKAGLERLAGQPPRAAVAKLIAKCPQPGG